MNDAEQVTRTLSLFALGWAIGDLLAPIAGYWLERLRDRW